jgi:NAD(P)-dependent dehydrogenase (short-subunit alcohol dehydrogenase family)
MYQTMMDWTFTGLFVLGSVLETISLNIVPITSFLFCSVLVLLLLNLYSNMVSRFMDSRVEHDPKKCLVVVTGCDSGLGRLYAQELSTQGYRVIACCYTEKACANLKDEVTATALLDVTNEKSIDNMYGVVQDVLDQRPTWKMWALINNAGVAHGGFVDWTEMETFRHVMEVNYFGLIALTKKLLPFFKASKWSRIINMSSLAGLAGGHNMSAYCASKHALEGFTIAFRKEMKPFKVLVANVNPGFIRTPLLGSTLQAGLQEFDNLSDELKALYDVKIVLDMGEQIKAIAEEPVHAVDLVCNYLMKAKNPPAVNFPGWAAFFMSMYLVFPREMRELIEYFSMPLRGVSHNQIHKLQRATQMAAEEAQRVQEETKSPNGKKRE